MIFIPQKLGETNSINWGPQESLVEMMPRLITDECIIGKIPNVTDVEFQGLFANW